MLKKESSPVSVTAEGPPGARKVTSDVAEFMRSILEKTEFGCSGDWCVRLTTQTKSTIRFKVRSFDHSAIKIRVMPGDSGTCWDCELTPPKNENVLVIGRELSLWNGYDGRNIPDAVLANRGEEPPDKEEALPNLTSVSLADSIGKAEKLATAYQARAKQIREQEARAMKLMQEASECDAEANRLREVHEADIEGKAADESLKALRRFLGVTS